MNGFGLVVGPLNLTPTVSHSSSASFLELSPAPSDLMLLMLGHSHLAKKLSPNHPRLGSPSLSMSGTRTKTELDQAGPSPSIGLMLAAFAITLMKTHESTMEVLTI